MIDEAAQPTAPTTAGAGGGAGVGTEVEVRSDFSGRWVSGFSVAESRPEGLRLRRKSDLHVLPAWFPSEQVRPLKH